MTRPHFTSGPEGAGATDRPDPQSRSLSAALRSRLDAEVRFDDGSRALYATTGSNYRQVPIGVVVPRTVEALVDGLDVCRQFGAPILMRGGGTSLAGQTCNVAVVFDTSKYLRAVLEVDPGRRRARVQPGTVLDDLRRAAEQHHLTFGPDPSTHAYCTLGGMIGNNSCGVHSVTAGRTSDNVEALEIVTGDGLRLRVGATSDRELDERIRAGGRVGAIYSGLRTLRDRYGDLIRTRFPKIPRRVSGYGLDELLPENGFHVARALVGSEGTCVTVLEATVRLVDSPRARVLLVLGYPDVFTAADHVPEILAGQPHGLEGLDDLLVADMRRQHLHPGAIELLPEGGGWLLAEFGGASAEEAADKARRLMETLGRGSHGPAMRLVEDPAEQHAVWLVREAGLGATAHVPQRPLTWEGWEDSAVHPERLGAYLRELRALLDRHHYLGDLYGHFGDGCVHTRINFDFGTHEGLRNYRSFLDEAADLVVKHGGSFSGEHGDGQARGALLPRLFGPELVEAFRQFKRLWDPEGRMNPGKVVDADPPDSHLRLGPDYSPRRPSTHFAYTEDAGDFAHTMLRCVGVGACRKTDSGTMCPSYMVTREEKHSTRGRARLLFEMLRGDTLQEGWRDERVHEALDLCLSCKGCKGECPVRVDMATYKAEFLSHYYAGRLRPRHAYAFGLIPWWARLGALVPWTAHRITGWRRAAPLLKLLADVAPQRAIPRFAARPFRGTAARQPRTTGNRRRVVLWPDTFNGHFHSATAEAAHEVLERGDFQVVVPSGRVCCGRPLYDYGMLDLARTFLRRTLDVLRDEIRQGTPVVVLEPSCASVFQDELRELFPGNDDARRLAEQTLSLAEFLERETDAYPWPRLAGSALLQGHCHQKALRSTEPEVAILRRIGLDVQVPDTGCCGMAGAFGFEAAHYDVSIAVGERVLLPAVRRAPASTFIVADGFSCREQIAQTTERQALHLADVLQIAARPDLQGTTPFVESALVRARLAEVPGVPSAREWLILAGAAAVPAVAWGLWRLGRGSHSDSTSERVCP